METKDVSNQQLYFSHTMRPDVGAIHAVAKQQEYHELYTKIEEHPTDPSMWDAIIDMAKQEEAKGTSVYLPTIPLDEMITQGRLLQHAQTQAERYHHLLERCSDGRLWYDIVLGGNLGVLDSVTPMLRDWVLQVRGGRKFSKALDIGTGTGNTVQKIAPFCRSVVGIDVLPEAIALAQTRTDILATSEFTVGDATHLQFPSKSVDLVISNGVTLYLTKDQEWKQNEEIHRVLRPGGMYVMINAAPEDVTKRDLHGAKELLEQLMGTLIKTGAPLASEQMKLGDARDQFIHKGYRLIRPRVEDKNWVRGLIKPRV